MCGIGALAGPEWDDGHVAALVASQRHRGPDDVGRYSSPCGLVRLAHTRLSVIDVSSAGHQPMSDPTGRVWITFNGELYNYRALRQEIADWHFTSQTDTEVALAAYVRWGPAALSRFIGMFAMTIWDERTETLFAARDRFGVKPLYFHNTPTGQLVIASEVAAIHAVGVPRSPDPVSWATYLKLGISEHTARSFSSSVAQVPAGCFLEWRPGIACRIERWYDLETRLADLGEDLRPTGEVEDQLRELLRDTVRLRLQADVPAGVCLSSGLDSSLLYALIRDDPQREAPVTTFTFGCGDARYDEGAAVRRLLNGDEGAHHFPSLTPEDVPRLAVEAYRAQGGPFGGIPTLAMTRLHQAARDCGVVVLLDANGLDESWGGYDYYQAPESVEWSLGPVQGSRDAVSLAECLTPDFAGLAEPLADPPALDSPLQRLQWRDICLTKLPRSLRFADRASMMSSRELREPFLDHRIVELGLRQPPAHTASQGVGKRLVRRIARDLLPETVWGASKRAVQTPQREWLRGPLRPWCEDLIEAAVQRYAGHWLDRRAVERLWTRYRQAPVDNSAAVWQLVSLGLDVTA